MDNLDDSENNAKISDSAYSNSCSNSQSRRSRSSKSTHSGSNSSGSSGYGGKPSTSGSSNNLQPPKKEKEPKKLKLLPQNENLVPDIVVEEVRAPEPVPTFDAPKEEQLDVVPTPPAQAEKNGVENMDTCVPELRTKDEVVSSNISQANPATNFASVRPLQASYKSVQSKLLQDIGRYEMRCENSEQLRCKDGFSCVISMHDGVVMYATSSLTSTLGFPVDMWIGRSFIDFVHPRDRNTFASQITKGLAVPKVANGTHEKVQCPVIPVLSMVCRIRRYRGLKTSFGVKESAVGFLPFLLKLTFKDVSDEEGKVVYLVIEATPFFSAFKTPNEMVFKATPFVIRHSANGHIEYVDFESVSYLGYLPQDLAGKDALMLYHPEDLMYLRRVYDTIIKEGGLPRSKSYRMVTQNGDYIRVETEWSSFINPWSKKLEFVTGKHHIVEGPNNPNVFHVPDPENTTKVSDEEKNKAQMLRDIIIRSMNESLTKPAELAKQQMTKRCQELATFMESLVDESPKTDEELRLEIYDPDHSCYERDSVMLGGISPHHDDSKTSTETPLSYNQINYNDTLQRYFDSHLSISYEGSNTASGENISRITTRPAAYSTCLSPMAQHSRDSGELTSSSESNGMITVPDSPLPDGDYHPIRLSEALLNKHNSEMQKELMKMHRETRTISKGDRENTNETRKKKKEHLARCNASFHPTSAGAIEVPQPQGLKRASKLEMEAGPQKHHCPSTRQTRRNKRVLSIDAGVTQPSSATAVDQLATAPNEWPTPSANNMNTFIVGGPPQMSILSPIPLPMQPMQPVPGYHVDNTQACIPASLYPMYYAPAGPQPMPSTVVHHLPSTSQQQQFQAPMMMYGHPMYGTPLMYTPMTQQVSYPMQQSQNMVAQSMPQYNNSMNPLPSTNYEEESGAEKADSTTYSTYFQSSNSFSQKPDLVTRTSDQDWASFAPTPQKTEPVTNTPPPRDIPVNKPNRPGACETDGESSYSSFYSSFFRTESGSAEDSGDGRNGNKPQLKSPLNVKAYHTLQPVKKVAARRKMDPPWLEQVCVNSELVYKYQIHTKSTEDTLMADQQKMNALEQSSLVNEQLSQLYVDLQLQGVAARLTLEEGITSSSSSGEETGQSVAKKARKKREYSKLVMIYEEDCPMPPPSDEATTTTEAVAGPSSLPTSDHQGVVARSPSPRQM